MQVPAQETKELYSLIDFDRAIRLKAGPCEACSIDVAEPMDLMVVLTFQDTMVVLCELCYTDLLGKLLTNWLKRDQKKKAQLPIPKEGTETK